MQCSRCGSSSADAARFCRQCGATLAAALARTTAEPGPLARTSDPDELVGSGIGKVIAGDGFFMVAVLLAFVESAVASLLWLLLLIPAFYLFGLGFADVFRARQIRRKDRERLEEARRGELQAPPVASIVDVFTKDTTRRLDAGSGGIAHR